MVFRAVRPNENPTSPSRVFDFANTPTEDVVCVAPTYKEACEWGRRTRGVYRVYKLSVRQICLIDSDGTPIPSNRWITWGGGLREAFVRLPDIECVEEVGHGCNSLNDED